MSNLNQVKNILTCKIDTPNVIDMDVFANGLHAIDELYKEIVDDKNVKIQIAEIRKGSIEIDIVANCIVPLLAIIPNINKAADFIELFKKICQFFLNKEDSHTEIGNISNPTVKQSQNVYAINQVIVNGGTVIFSDKNSGESFILDKSTANQINNKIPTYIEEQTKKEEREEVLNDVWVSFVQTRKDNKKGNKIVCSRISKKELPVNFDNDYLKEQIIKKDKSNTYNYEYLVDLKINYLESKVANCTILSLKNKKKIQKDKGKKSQRELPFK